MANKQDEPPKKRVKDLQEKLEQWAKEKAKDVPEVVKELKLTLAASGKEEDKLNAFNQTFIKKSSDIPDDLKKLVGACLDNTQRQPTDSVRQPTSGATGNTENTTDGKSHKTPKPLGETTGHGAGTGKRDAAKPQLSSTLPSVNKQTSNSLEQEIDNLKKELAKETLQFEDQKRLADNRLSEIDEKEKEMKLKEEEVLLFQKKYEDMKTKWEEMKTKWEKASELSEERQKSIVKFEEQVNKHYEIEFEYKKKIEKFEENELNMTKELDSYKEHCDKLFKDKHMLEKKEKSLNREVESLNATIADEKRKNAENIKKLMQERDDLRDRFSKVAGAKLSDDNSDIADLSDPNRAMKLSERFGQLYDDEWTNAFEALTDKDQLGMHHKEAIRMLLLFLQDCLDFCEKVKTSQLDILSNVFLHPIQSSKLATSDGMKGMRERPRIASKEEKTLRELRKQINVHPGVIEEVKQAFIVEVKSWEKKGVDKKHVEACIPYLQKCAELCWLIALHDPPLFMKFDVKPGDKFDQNVYTVYSASGNKIDYLVWPPLYNGENGGLLSKGTAEPIKSVKKGK